MRLKYHLPQVVTALFFAVLLAALTFRMVQFLAEAWRAINFPFGLDWAEGAVWAEAMLIPGPHMYGPVDVPPFLIFPYPLVYHLAVRGLVGLGADPLMAGRRWPSPARSSLPAFAAPWSTGPCAALSPGRRGFSAQPSQPWHR